MAEGDISPIQHPAIVQQSGQSTELAATASGSPAEFNASTRISSFEDLEGVSPELAKAMKEGIATNIINEMRSREEERRKRAREIYQW